MARSQEELNTFIRGQRSDNHTEGQNRPASGLMASPSSRHLVQRTTDGVVAVLRPVELGKATVTDPLGVKTGTLNGVRSGTPLHSKKKLKKADF